jgi:TolA-binding protein
MKLTDILKKVTAGEELNQEEKDFLAAYKPEEIPKSRLDAEIAKRKEAETRKQELETKLEELSGKVEELEGKGLTEVDKVKKENEKELAKLKKQVTDLTSEKETSVNELNSLKRKASISELAAKHNFTDPEFLDFKASTAKLDLADDAKVKEFMGDLQKASPKMFKVDANPGGGSKPGTGDKGNTDYATAKEKGDKVAMIAAAPEIK